MMEAIRKPLVFSPESLRFRRKYTVIQVLGMLEVCLVSRARLRETTLVSTTETFYFCASLSLVLPGSHAIVEPELIVLLTPISNVLGLQVWTIIYIHEGAWTEVLTQGFGFH